MDGEFVEIVHPKKRAFLAAYAESGLIGYAAECAGIHRNAPAVWRHTDSQFAAAFEVAREHGFDVLESVALDRACGYEQVTIIRDGDGKEVERRRVTKVSNSLLIFLLKGMRPEYRDNYSDPSALRETFVTIAALMREHLDLQAYRSFRLELGALAEKEGIRL